MNNTSLGQRIRLARKEMGMTQHDLAQGIVTSSMICQIENGKAFPSYPVLSALAERLGRPIEYFVSDTDTSKRQRSTYTLAKALMASGSYEKAYSLLKSIEDNHASDSDEFQLTLSECCQQLGKFEEASAPLDEMLQAAMHQGNLRRSFALLQRLGDIAERAGQHQLALYHWQKAHDLMGRADVEPSEQSRLLTSIGNTYYKLEYIDEAVQFLNRAYEHRETFLSLEELGQMYLSLSLSYRDSNDFAQASYFSDQAYTIFKSLTNMKMTTDVKRSLAVLMGKQGEYEQALRMLDECQDTYAASNDLHNVGLTQVEMAAVLQQADQLDEAVTMMQYAIEALLPSELESARAHRLLADIYHCKRDLPSAIQHLNRSMQLYQKQGDSVGMVEAMNLSVRLYQEWDTIVQDRYGTGITA